MAKVLPPPVSITMTTTEGLRRKNFLLGKMKSEEQINSENKATKEKKKEYKVVLKSNKDVIEEITKSSTESSRRMEQQISRIREDIKESNGNLQETVASLVQTLKTILVPGKLTTRTDRAEEIEPKTNHEISDTSDTSRDKAE